MGIEPKDLGMTDDQARDASRKMAYIILGGPDAWEKIRPKLMTPEVLPLFQKLKDEAPERMELSFVQHARGVAHQIIDHYADMLELWALTENRRDLDTPLAVKLAEAEKEFGTGD